MAKFFSILGLAKRAGMVLAGEALVENAVRQAQAKLLILAKDASDNTKKKFHNSALYYGIPIIEVGTKSELGHAIGEEYRAIVAVTDSGFVEKLQQILEQ